MTRPETQTLLDALTADGTEVRFVGGCVRDAVANKTVEDVDLATPDPPETVIALLEAADITALPTGIHHGTVTAIVNDYKYEITTLRIDLMTDGRRAKVAYTDDWIADAARRDFTINTLSCTPDGNIYDPFHGLDDLGNKVVRFVGNARDRIEEDILRLLRYFRFYAAYGKHPPDKAALDACRIFAPKLPSLSAERIWREFRRILLGPNPEDVITLLRSERILDYVLPEAGPVGRLRMMSLLETKAINIDSVKPDPIRRLAAALNPEKPDPKSVAKHFKLSNKDAERLNAISTAQFVISVETTEDELRRLLYTYKINITRDVLLLIWAQELSTAENRGSLRTQAWLNHLSIIDTFEEPAFPLSGEDVLKLGIPSGRDVGTLLNAVENWWVSENFKASREACLNELKSQIKSRTQ
ncbi:MAG: CCA tRNA nucleotidyltransferase [Rhodospirillaceae bacterium]